MLFDEPLVRFGTSGTLIMIYSLVDRLARKHGGVPRERMHAPRWLGPFIFASVLAFYLTIEPFGGAIAGGAGNGVGIALVAMATHLRWAWRLGRDGLRQPDTATRMLFYAALPLAVGSPWGWLVLSLPALAVSAWWAVREDDLLLARHGETWRGHMSRTHRWIPGLW